LASRLAKEGLIVDRETANLATSAAQFGPVVFLRGKINELTSCFF
jgi:hypothetical protein